MKLPNSFICIKVKMQAYENRKSKDCVIKIWFLRLVFEKNYDRYIIIMPTFTTSSKNIIMTINLFFLCENF